MTAFEKSWVQGSYLFTKNLLTGEVKRSPLGHGFKFNKPKKEEFKVFCSRGHPKVVTPKNWDLMDMHTYSIEKGGKWDWCDKCSEHHKFHK